MNGNDVANAGNVSTKTMTATGNIATNGENPNDMPPGWGGGVRTWDVYAGGTVAAGPGGGAQPAAYMNYTGQISGRQINSSGDVSANGNLFGANGVVTNGNVTLSSDRTSIINPGRMHINAGENLYLQPWSGGRTVVGGGGGSGQLEVSGRLYADEYVQVNGWAQQGAGCGPNGLIANSGNGPLFCQSGVWTAGGSLSTVQVDTGGWQSQAYAGCPASYTVIGGSCAMTRGRRSGNPASDLQATGQRLVLQRAEWGRLYCVRGLRALSRLLDTERTNQSRGFHVATMAWRCAMPSLQIDALSKYQRLGGSGNSPQTEDQPTDWTSRYCSPTSYSSRPCTPPGSPPEVLRAVARCCSMHAYQGIGRYC